MNRWQFSVRGLLVLTANLSLVLAFAVTLPGVFQALLIAAAVVALLAVILASANFATSYQRPRLAVLSWILLGAFFSTYALALLGMIRGGVDRVAGPPLGILVMGTCSLICFHSAYRSYQLIGRSGSAVGGEPERAPLRATTAEPKDD